MERIIDLIKSIVLAIHFTTFNIEGRLLVLWMHKQKMEICVPDPNSCTVYGPLLIHLHNILSWLFGWNWVGKISLWESWFYFEVEHILFIFCFLCILILTAERNQMSLNLEWKKTTGQITFLLWLNYTEFSMCL